MKYILDTDILIYWMKGVPAVVNTVNSQGTKTLVASVITRAELFYGAYKSQHVEKNLGVISKLAKVIQFLPLDEQAQEIFGKIKTKLRKQGSTLADTDLLIAATAIATNRILVTNNTRHFERIPELRIENWAIPGS